MDEKIARIQKLKEEKDAVILAHYYVDGEIQEIADYVGDSYYLSEIAQKGTEQTIVMCGVSFMGESAKILSPSKTVLLPDAEADCPMAHMASVQRIEEVRREYEDVAVVCYVNSTAELKAHSDVCVTSSNALKIVKSLPNQYIYFIPDQHLAHYVADQVPEKHFIFNDGYCPVHNDLTKEAVEEVRAARPQAELLVHPECRGEVTALADYVGSTSGIIQYAGESKLSEFIIGTETGVFYELQKQNPEKKFYSIGKSLCCCNDMKKITLDKIIKALETGSPAVELAEDLIKRAHEPLVRMLELSRQDG